MQYSSQIFEEQTFCTSKKSLYLLPESWISCDGVVIMAIVLSWFGIPWCETLGWETLMGQLVGDSQIVADWPIHFRRSLTEQISLAR